MMERKNYILRNLFYLSLFTINIPFFLPYHYETQPILAILTSFWLIKRNARKIFLFFTYDMLLAYIIIVILTVYYYAGLTGYGYGNASLAAYIKYAIGPTIFLAIRGYPDFFAFNKKFIRICVGTLFLIFLLLHIDEIKYFHEYLIPRSQRSFAGRFNILTTEPSYFSYFFVVLILSMEILDIQYPDEKGKNLIYKVLILIMAASTKSALVFMFILVYAGVYILQFRLMIKVILFFGLLGALTFLVLFTNNRITELIDKIYLVLTGNTNLSEFIMTGEPSGSTRIILNYFGMSNFIDHPLGTGLNSFLYTMQNTDDFFGIPLSMHETIRYKNTPYAHTYLANFFNDTGVFGFLLILLIIIGNKRNLNTREKKPFQFVLYSLFIMFFFQCQISNPIPWMLLAYLKRKRT